MEKDERETNVEDSDLRDGRNAMAENIRIMTDPPGTYPRKRYVPGGENP